MPLGLGNTLTKGGGLLSDGLSLSLQFAADKSLAARKGPTPTFTRASSATFVGSNGLIQSAAINTARFDHDPVTLACKGLLIEESRTNLALHSQDFSQSFYTKIGASISSVSGTSPSGGSTIQKFVEDTSTGGHGVEWALGPSGTFTLSVFAKAAERQWLRFTGNAIGTWFDLQNGVIGTIGAGQTASITNLGNGWYRCSSTFTTTAASSVLIRIATGNNNTTYTGDGASGLYLWGAQLEAGSFPTSYIPTTTATVVRSADVCSITGSAFTSFYNQSEGTVLLQATSLMATATAGNRTFLSFTDGSYTNQQGIYKTFSSSSLSVPIGSGVGTAVGTITQGVAFKVAVALQLANSAASFNGGNAATVASAVVVGINQLKFRDPTEAAGGHPSCHIASIRYYKKRLANAKLQALTA